MPTPPLGERPGLREFVLEAGRALSLAGTAVGETQERLTRIAAAGGAPAARIVVLPTTLLARLQAIRSMRPRYGQVATTIAYTVMTVGFCLILQPTALDVLVAAGLGALAGALAVLARGRSTLSVFAPVLAATAAVGLIGVTEVVGNPAAAGAQDLVQPLAAIVAIAFGVLCGSALWQGLTTSVRLRRRPCSPLAGEAGPAGAPDD